MGAAHHSRFHDVNPGSGIAHRGQHALRKERRRPRRRLAGVPARPGGLGYSAADRQMAGLSNAMSGWAHGRIGNAVGLRIRSEGSQLCNLAQSACNERSQRRRTRAKRHFRPWGRTARTPSSRRRGRRRSTYTPANGRDAPDSQSIGTQGQHDRAATDFPELHPHARSTDQRYFPGFEPVAHHDLPAPTPARAPAPAPEFAVRSGPGAGWGAGRTG